MSYVTKTKTIDMRKKGRNKYAMHIRLYRQRWIIYNKSEYYIIHIKHNVIWNK